MCVCPSDCNFLKPLLKGDLVLSILNGDTIYIVPVGGKLNDWSVGVMDLPSQKTPQSVVVPLGVRVWTSPSSTFSAP